MVLAIYQTFVSVAVVFEQKNGSPVWAVLNGVRVVCWFSLHSGFRLLNQSGVATAESLLENQEE